MFRASRFSEVSPEALPNLRWVNHWEAAREGFGGEAGLGSDRDGKI